MKAWLVQNPIDQDNLTLTTIFQAENLLKYNAKYIITCPKCPKTGTHLRTQVISEIFGRIVPSALQFHSRER
jgi:hypothetical protein